MKIMNFTSFINENDSTAKSFEELSEETKILAIEKNRDINISHDWWEDTIGIFAEDMLKYGLTIDPDEGVQFSGFHSQGDGASFVTESIDSEEFMKEGLELDSNEFLDMEEPPKDELQQLVGDMKEIGFDNRERLTPADFYFNVVRTSSNYSHENTVSMDMDFDELEKDDDDDDRDFDSFASGLEDDATEWIRDKCKELYKKLEDYNNELTSDKEVAESLISNEYMFDEEGDIVYNSR